MVSCQAKHTKLRVVELVHPDGLLEWICANCGDPVQPQAEDSWRHVAPGRRFSGKSRFLESARTIVVERRNVP